MGCPRNIIAFRSHAPTGACIDSIRRDFLESGTVEGLDTSCLESESAGPFRLPRAAPSDDTEGEDG